MFGLFKKDENNQPKESLIEAVEKQNLFLVQKLSQSKKYINELNENEETALFVAVMLKCDKENLQRKYKTIEILLQSKIAVYKKNKYGYNILQIMTGKSDYYEIRKIFNKYGYFQDEAFENINIKKDENSIPTLKRELNINERINGVTPLYKAIVDNDIELVKKLLEDGADINLKNSDKYTVYKNLGNEWYEHGLKTPLDGIIDSNNLTILKLITLEDKDISNLLDQAIIKRKIEIALYLIEKSKNLNEKAFLILECKDKIEPKFEIIKSLVEHNIDVNTLDEYNKSALFYLIESMYMDIDTIKFLIDNGADTNKGYPPLKLACQKQDYKLIKLLVNHGADVNAVDSYNGQSALFDAIEAKKANIDIIKFLLDNGADINQEDNKGITPLSFAQSNKKSLVKILTTVEEKKITKKQTPDRTMEYQELSKKITAQNRVINNLKKEIESLKENSNQKDFINELENQIEIQAKKIYTLENERLEKELETQKIITELLTKMETLEKNISKRSRVKKSSSIPTNIKIEHQSLKKDDGIIVKRDSFDDF